MMVESGDFPSVDSSWLNGRSSSQVPCLFAVALPYVCADRFTSGVQVLYSSEVPSQV